MLFGSDGFMRADIVIVGTGVSGLFCALNLPRDKKIVMISKSSLERSDSYLAQGGICVLRDGEDYDSYYEDTMRAGHYECKPESVDIMIRSSRDVIDDLVNFGVQFDKKDGEFVYTKEGAHSKARILFHKDITGKEITSKLLCAVKKLDNVVLYENTVMVDIVERDGECCGIVVKNSEGDFSEIRADYTVVATGGIGGLFAHSTNYSHLTADSLAIAIKHGVKLKDIDYIQIHPTTLYSEKAERKFLISESVRGEGAILLDKNGERFVNELLPRDVVAEAIHKQMEKDGTKHVMLSMSPIPKEHILSHFPNIYQRCLDEGYDVTKEPIPVVPAQHYFMGGIEVDRHSKTSMERLYAVGETACNGVHGKNRLASNSLLESLVFAKRCAKNIADTYTAVRNNQAKAVNGKDYENYGEEYRSVVLSAIEKEKKKR